MNAQAISKNINQIPETIPSTSKGGWNIDPTGGKIFYPFGPAFRGYRVLDAAAETEIRAADEQYERSSLKFIRLVSGASTTGFLLLLVVVFERHPVLAVILFYAAIVFIFGAIAVFRFRAVRSRLADLATTPAIPDSRLRLVQTLATMAMTVFGFWLALYLYDVRLSALVPDHPGDLRFYPTIAGNLIFVAVGLPFLFTTIVHFGALSSKAGQNQTTLAVILFSLLQMGALANIAYKFIAPTPRIVVAQRSLWCGWKHNWREIGGVDRGDDSRYAIVALQAPVVRALGISNERCRIDGLSVDYDEVYHAIVTAWLPHVNDP